MADPLPAPTKGVMRFKPMTTPCEWIECYSLGGYHPVHLGDQFKNSQYCVIRKLGVGSFSTVWLVVDTMYVFDCPLVGEFK
jgi:hypothetical protein